MCCAIVVVFCLGWGLAATRLSFGSGTKAELCPSSFHGLSGRLLGEPSCGASLEPPKAGAGTLCEYCEFRNSTAMVKRMNTASSASLRGDEKGENSMVD